MPENTDWKAKYEELADRLDALETRPEPTLSGAALKTDKDPKPDDQGKTVKLIAPGGTKVTAPERSAESLKAAGFKGR